MKKLSKIIYRRYDIQKRNHRGLSHWSFSLDLKTALLFGILPGLVRFEHGKYLLHFHFFVSALQMELTFII